MKLFRNLVIGMVLLFVAPAFSQTTTKLCFQNGGGCPLVTPSNPLPVNASVSASISGWPGTTQTTGTPISVTTSGVTGTLPSGAVVLATNVGSNTAYCKLGASATTSDTPIFANSSVAFTVGSNTQLTCITTSSTTAVNMSGGSGLPTGWGGGGSGGSGSNASVSSTGSAVPGSATYGGMNVGGNLAGLSGTAFGLLTDESTSSQFHTDFNQLHTDLGTLNTTAGGPIAAGTNIIGYTSSDPCSRLTKQGAPINLTASGQIITGASGKKTYICGIDVVTATAQNIALVEGTGTACATNIYGLAGGTTAATGWNFSANSGIARGAGSGTVYSPSGDTNATAANVCLLLSNTGQTSGQIVYVQQ